MRKHLLAMFVGVGIALFVHGFFGLKLDYKGDVLSGWNDSDRIIMAFGALMAVWAFIEHRSN